MKKILAIEGVDWRQVARMLERHVQPPQSLLKESGSRNALLPRALRSSTGETGSDPWVTHDPGGNAHCRQLQFDGKTWEGVPYFGLSMIQVFRSTSGGRMCHLRLLRRAMTCDTSTWDVMYYAGRSHSAGAIAELFRLTLSGRLAINFDAGKVSDTVALDRALVDASTLHIDVAPRIQVFRMQTGFTRTAPPDSEEAQA